MCKSFLTPQSSVAKCHTVMTFLKALGGECSRTNMNGMGYLSQMRLCKQISRVEVVSSFTSIQALLDHCQYGPLKRVLHSSSHRQYKPPEHILDSSFVHSGTRCGDHALLYRHASSLSSTSARVSSIRAALESKRVQRSEKTTFSRTMRFLTLAKGRSVTHVLGSLRASPLGQMISSPIRPCMSSTKDDFCRCMARLLFYSERSEAMDVSK